MVIYLDRQLIQGGVAEKGFFDFLRNMMLAYKEGKHLIVIDIREIKGLISNHEVDDITKVYLNHYLTHNKGLIDAISQFKIIVQPVILKEIEGRFFDPVKKNEVRKIRFNKFLDSSSIQKTILLGENGNDADVYALFAKFYLRSISNNKLIASYSRRTGGGSTTHEEYKEIYTNTEYFCLCVLDSDRKTKSRGYGQTALKVAKFHFKQNSQNLKCDYVILPVLEVENLFPERFYLKKYVFKYPSEIFPSIRRMEEIDKFARKYFDFKKGIKGFYATNDEGLIIYWGELISQAGIKASAIDEQQNYCYVSGFGENILTDFLGFDTEDIFNFVNTDPALKKIWLKLGKHVSSFVIGSQVPRAI